MEYIAFYYKVMGIPLGRGLSHYIGNARAGIVSVPMNAILILLIISAVSALVIDFSTDFYNTGHVNC